MSLNKVGDQLIPFIIQIGFPGGTVVKNPPAKAGGARDTSSIGGSGRAPGGGNGNPSSVLAWKIPWTEEPGGLQSTGSHRVGHDRACAHIHIQCMAVK